MKNFKEGFVPLNYVPTRVLTWGGWIEDEDKSSWKEIVILFTGNPGVTAYYIEFLALLHEKLKVPVWIVSHGGHEIPSDRMMPKLESNHNLFNVSGQIQSKKEFFRLYVPRHVKVHLIGHSVGAYMALQLLKDDDLARQVQMSYLLFPTLESMAVTPNGRFYTGVAEKFLWLVYFLAGVFHSLPHFLGLVILVVYFRIFGKDTSPTVKDATQQLINPRILRTVFFLASDEMDQIKDLDIETVKKRKEKIVLYYSDHDNWAPLYLYEKLVKAVPGINAKVCTKGCDHAFMLHKPSVVMSEIVFDMIQQHRLK